MVFLFYHVLFTINYFRINIGRAFGLFAIITIKYLYLSLLEDTYFTMFIPNILKTSMTLSTNFYILI